MEHVTLSDVIGEKLTSVICYCDDNYGGENVVLYFGDKYLVLESYSTGYDHETGISIKGPAGLTTDEIYMIEQKLGDSLI